MQAAGREEELEKRKAKLQEREQALLKQRNRFLEEKKRLITERNRLITERNHFLKEQEFHNTQIEKQFSEKRTAFAQQFLNFIQKQTDAFIEFQQNKEIQKQVAHKETNEKKIRIEIAPIKKRLTKEELLKFDGIWDEIDKNQSIKTMLSAEKKEDEFSPKMDWDLETVVNPLKEEPAWSVKESGSSSPSTITPPDTLLKPPTPISMNVHKFKVNESSIAAKLEATWAQDREEFKDLFETSKLDITQELHGTYAKYSTNLPNENY